MIIIGIACNSSQVGLGFATEIARMSSLPVYQRSFKEVAKKNVSELTGVSMDVSWGDFENPVYDFRLKDWSRYLSKFQQNLDTVFARYFTSVRGVGLDGGLGPKVWTKTLFPDRDPGNVVWILTDVSRQEEMDEIMVRGGMLVKVAYSGEWSIQDLCDGSVDKHEDWLHEVSSIRYPAQVEANVKEILDKLDIDGSGL